MDYLTIYRIYGSNIPGLIRFIATFFISILEIILVFPFLIAVLILKSGFACYRAGLLKVNNSPDDS